MRDALGWNATESLIGVGLFMVAVMGFVIIATRLAKSNRGDAAIFAGGMVLAVLLYPVALLILVGMGVWLVVRRRRRRRVAAGLALDPRAARRWAKAAPNEVPAPVRGVDPEFEAVAARCQGRPWAEAMAGAGLARPVREPREGEGIGAALGVILAHRDPSVQVIHGQALHVPPVVTVAPSPVGAVIKVRPLPGQGPADFGTAMRADRIAAHLRVPVEVAPGSPDGLVTLTARWRDPLATLAPLDDAPVWDGDWKRLPLGVLEDGSLMTLSLHDLAGLVIGGLTGGGKTASLATALSPLMRDSRVQFVVIDGKGGADWSWIEPRCAFYSNEDADIPAIADHLEKVVEYQRWRTKNMKRLRGQSSFWGSGGPTEALPLVVVIVDECQTYLDKSMISKDWKEGQDARVRIEGALANLVRKGRSAGMLTIVATQKPTANSLPTTIGANAPGAIAFRVKTAAAEAAIFGSSEADESEEGGAKARHLPEGGGYAVMGLESGARTRFRAFYVPETRLEEIAAEAAGLARPDLLTPPAPPTEDDEE